MVAMIRGEKDIMEFYYQALRKHMMRKTKKGVGITIMNKKMYSKGWRPLLPVGIEKSYPQLCRLIKRCWSQKQEERPGFDEIVRVMQGEVADEVRRRDEPEIVVLGEEADEVYHDRMEGDGENLGGEGEQESKRERNFVARAEYDAVMEELEKLRTQYRQ